MSNQTQLIVVPQGTAKVKNSARIVYYCFRATEQEKISIGIFGAMFRIHHQFGASECVRVYVWAHTHIVQTQASGVRQSESHHLS